ncbi:hypothetical protein Ancab_007809 [Ancistrocladus abbreviatus]
MEKGAMAHTRKSFAWQSKGKETSWLKGCYVGQLLDRCHLERLQDWDKKEEGRFLPWLEKLRVWSPCKVSVERMVWIHCRGIPLHAWTEDIFGKMASVAEEDGMRYVQSGVEEASGPVGRTCDQSRTNLKFSPMCPSISVVSCTLEEAPQSPLEIGKLTPGKEMSCRQPMGCSWQDDGPILDSGLGSLGVEGKADVLCLGTKKAHKAGSGRVGQMGHAEEHWWCSE